MTININSYYFLILFGSLISEIVHATPTISPQKNPPAAASYSVIAPDWRVSSVYGPRNAGSSGSKFHKGIDYNQQAGDGDLGVLLTARSGGSIKRIDQGWLTIQSSSYSFDYLHIFDAKVVSNKNTSQAGYSKVALSTIKTDKGITCNAVFFYNLQAKLVKIITKNACSEFVQNNNGNQLKAQVTVSANEAIATMGKSGTNNAHLHLQLNGGNDNALTKIIHPTGLIAGKTNRFEVKLVEDTFTDTKLNAMTNGAGFAIEITENSLVPVLDEVIVLVAEMYLPPFIFSFGGAIDSHPSNVSETNIDASFDLAKGSTTPKIKPKTWAEMGKPRTMTFFVPYKFKLLFGGVYNLLITINTIDKKSEDFNIKFAKSSFIKIANNGKELPYRAVLGNQPNDWACTKDTRTGFIWEVKADDGKLRDKHWEYTWHDPKYLPDAYDKFGVYDQKHDADGIWAGWDNPEQNLSYYAPKNKELCNAIPKYCTTFAYTQAVNEQGLCAANNWRMPNKDELIRLSSMRYIGFNPLYMFIEKSIDPSWNVEFWSSSPVNGNSEEAWTVNENSSLGSESESKEFAFSVRLVH